MWHHACVQKQHCNVNVSDLVCNSRLVVLDCKQRCKVADHSSGLDLWVLRTDRLQHLRDLVVVPGHNADVKTLRCNLVTDLETDAVRAASDNSPRVDCAVACVVVALASQKVTVDVVQD